MPETFGETGTRSPRSPLRRFRGLVLLALLLGLESMAVWSLRYTVGDWARPLAILVVLGSVITAAGLAAFGRTRAAGRAIAVIAATIVLVALWFAHLWIRLQLEAQRVVIYAYERRLETGAFPATLEAYRFRDPLLERHLQSFESDSDRIRLVFYVGHPSVSYWYDSKTGWGYYPD